MTVEVSREEALELYRSVLRIRRVEEALARRYAEQEMRCPMHLCIGQEAAAVGVCAALGPGDVVFSNHRPHGHYLARGGSLERMLAEMYGRATGCCGGRGGSMHLIDLEAGFLASTAIVGGTVPVAVGAAWAARLRGERSLAVAFFGDGCFEEGVVHESMNFAVLRRLPVLFVCENNGYSVCTGLEERQPPRALHQVAVGHGCAAHHGDGNDVREVARIARDAARRAREGEGPQFLELATYRWLEHCGPDEDDHLGYRPVGEVERWRARCPVEIARRQLVEGAGTVPDLEAIEAEVAAEIADAFRFALDSPLPPPEIPEDEVYAK